ncbi:MAG: hypothetical protein N2596_07630 [Syntrophorhabdaceae bacterium]|nr:hypothetical protein [Syntrophorhabdaceae bacterium]
MFLKSRLKVCCSLFIIFALFLFIPSKDVSGIEKKPKISQKVAPQKVEQVIVINDSNLQSSIKVAEDLVKKGEFQGALNIFLKSYDFTKSVLTTINLLQKHYEKIASDPNTSLSDKEYIMIRLKRMENLLSKYKEAKETSAYYIGFIYTKRGETDKARKYLFEVLESVPFDLNKESIWMKTKSLLLEAYNLEGEF